MIGSSSVIFVARTLMNQAPKKFSWKPSDFDSVDEMKSELPK